MLAELARPLAEMRKYREMTARYGLTVEDILAQLCEEHYRDDFARLRSFRYDGSFVAWLYWEVRNAFRNLIRSVVTREDAIEPNLDYELNRYAQKTGQHITFNKEAREKFLAFALDPANRWPGNFRDLNAMVVRMATLSDGGRITEEVVEEEIARCRDCLNHTRGRDCLNRVNEDSSSSSDANETFASTDAVSFASTSPAVLTHLLGADYAMRYDSADLAQLAHVIAICRESTSAADAAKKLYAVSRKAKSSSNDSDRLTKYLARFGLKFRAIISTDRV